ncbi:hypothetical protein BC628DRAFT_1362439 [Trametes gibbosa]|nr:hypothetical protein BC628DRAFT_1362439 [Trametes gibbosa]
MRLAAMYGLKHIQLLDIPADRPFLQFPLSPRDIDLGKLYLGVSLAIFISFMTYYAITLSLELYRTIASSYIFLKSTKSNESSRDRARILKQRPGPPSSAATESDLNIPSSLSSSAPTSCKNVVQDTTSTSSTSHHADQPTPEIANSAHASSDNSEYSSIRVELVRPHHFEEIGLIVDNPPAELQEEGTPRSTRFTDSRCNVSCVMVMGHLAPLENASHTSAIQALLEPEAPCQPTQSALLLPATPSALSLVPCDDLLQSSAASATYLLALSDELSPSTETPEANTLEELSIAAGTPTQEDLNPLREHVLRGTAYSSALLRDPTTLDDAAEAVAVKVVDHRSASERAPVLLEDLAEVLEHNELPHTADADQRTTPSDLIDVSNSIMESAILIEGGGSDSEPCDGRPDTDREAEWTTINRDDCEDEENSTAPADAVPRPVQDEPGSMDVLLRCHSVELPAVVVTPNDDLDLGISDITQSPDAREVLLVTTEPTAVEHTACAPFPQLNSPPGGDGVALPALPDTTNRQLSSTPRTYEGDDPADIYIGPLPSQSMRARVHTEENPDWAVAPNVRPKPRRHAKGNGTVNGWKNGYVKKAVAEKLTSSIVVPPRPKDAVAQPTTKAGGDEKPRRRRSARLSEK